MVVLVKMVTRKLNKITMSHMLNFLLVKITISKLHQRVTFLTLSFLSQRKPLYY